MALRDYLFRLVADDPTMISLGLNESSGFAVQAMFDAPSGPFWVMKISGRNRGLAGSDSGSGDKPVYAATAALWVYGQHGEEAYERVIDPALARWEAMMNALAGPDMGDGSFMIGKEYVGQAEDGWDDVYERITRSSSYTISYTGF